MKTTKLAPSESKPMILLDFDRTLFDTDAYWQDFVLVLARASGKPDNAYIKDYDDFLIGNDRLRMVDYQKILAVTGAKHQDIYENLARVANGKQYLFDDARLLLDQLAHLKNLYDVAIVTFGETEYQKLKLGLVPEVANMDKHIIQKLKTDYIAETFVDRYGMLVDDKFGQYLPTGWAEVNIYRQQNYEKPATIKSGVCRITSLKDVLVVAPELVSGYCKLSKFDA